MTLVLWGYATVDSPLFLLLRSQLSVYISLLAVKCPVFLAAFKVFSLSLMSPVSWWLSRWRFLFTYSAWDLLGLFLLRFGIFYQLWKILSMLSLTGSLFSLFSSDLDVCSTFLDSECTFLGTVISDSSLRFMFTVGIFILCRCLRGLYSSRIFKTGFLVLSFLGYGHSWILIPDLHQ